MYPDDYGDWLPPNISNQSRNQPGSWVSGNAKQDLITSNIQDGVIFIYHRSVDIYRCPADQSVVLGTTGRRSRAEIC